MKQPLIRFENVFKKFGANQVLQGVNPSIYQGEVATTSSRARLSMIIRNAKDKNR